MHKTLQSQRKTSLSHWKWRDGLGGARILQWVWDPVRSAWMGGVILSPRAEFSFGCCPAVGFVLTKGSYNYDHFRTLRLKLRFLTSPCRTGVCLCWCTRSSWFSNVSLTGKYYWGKVSTWGFPILKERKETPQLTGAQRTEISPLPLFVTDKRINSGWCFHSICPAIDWFLGRMLAALQKARPRQYWIGHHFLVLKFLLLQNQWYHFRIEKLSSKLIGASSANYFCMAKWYFEFLFEWGRP